MESNSNDLFELIKSLSKTEKRYYTLDQKRTTKALNLQLLLFTILNNMEVYDEAKVIASLFKKTSQKDEAQVTKFVDRIGVEKNHLYYDLLRSLQNYNTKNSNYIKLKNYLIHAKHLLDKGLFQQCSRLLGKAKGLALELNDQLALLEINKTERSLVWVLKSKQAEASITQFIQEKDNCLELLKTEHDYQDIYDQLCLEMAKHQTLPQSQIQEFKAQFQEILMKDDPQQKKTMFANLRHIQAKGFYNILLDDQKAVFNTLAEEFQWWENHPQYKSEDFFRYKISLNNYILGHYRRKKFEEVLHTLEKLERKENKTSFEELMVFELTSIFKLLIFLNTSKLEKAKDLVPYIKKGLKTHVISRPRKMVILFNLGSMFFIEEDFKESEEWLHLLIKGQRTSTRIDIRIFANLILAICYFELDEDEKVEKILRSVQRQIRMENQVGPQELAFNILNYLRTINKTPLFEQKNELSKFQKYLETRRAEANQKQSVPFWDEFFIWTQSRLTRRPMWEILKDMSNEHT